MHRFTLAILVLSLSVFMFSCRKGVETARYPLTEEQLNFIPYQQGQSVNFIHSGGHTFDFEVISLERFWLKTETEHPGENYASYETLEVKLESTEPDLQCKLTINPYPFYSGFTCEINYFHFIMGSLTEPIYDSLQMQGKIFKNVFVMADTNPTTNIEIDSVYYTISEGIIKIGMTNDEAYYIHN